MKHFSLKTITLIAAVSGMVSCVPAEKEVQRPNIVYIMSDDHAFQAISAYGTGLYNTPNIDRLAKEGAIFTRASVTNSICAPSRAVMLTGKHSFINGKVDNIHPFDWDQPNFPKLLQANGYQTAMIGKIHLDGIPQGFDYSMVLPGQGHYFNPDFLIGDERVRKEGYVTDIITDATIDWIKNQRDPNKPFCVLYHHKAPHREWEPAERHFREYTQKTFPEPATLFDDYTGRGTAARLAEMNILEHMNWAGDSKLFPETMEELGIQPPVTDPTNATPDVASLLNNIGRYNPEQKAAWLETYTKVNNDFKKQYPSMSREDLMKWRYQRYMQDYLGTIAAIDEGLGKLLDYLEEAGLAENTIVVYTSDQGFFLGEHGWFDKRFMYEESFRTPLLIRFPKEIKPGTKIDKLVQNLDFAPTFLDYAGIEIPKAIQGKSFRRLLNGKSDQWRDAVYYTFYEYPSTHMVKRHYGVSTDRYKLIHFYYDIDEWEMYDLQVDPMEMNNIYEDTAYAEVREILHRRLQEIRTQYGDSDELNQKFLRTYLNHRAK